MAENTAFSILTQRSIGSSRPVFEMDSANHGYQPDTDPVRSLYIHIPFCSHKCHYCDFYSIVDRQDRQEAFTSRLVRELIAQAPACRGEPLRTIFVGGGTPSLLAPDLWSTLLRALDDYFDLSEIKSGSGEFSVECNPESVSEELAGVLVGGGVNRASLGAQSFLPKHLKALERLHDPRKVQGAIGTLRNAGIQRVSIDLIYAIPQQTLDEWDHDLQIALSLPIEHLSAYALTYEPGTALTARLQRGEFAQAPDEIEVEMYQHAMTTLRHNGFDRYEVSNHAKPGAACRHNLAYWRQEQWLAIGPSASGHVRGHRWKNTPRLEEYLKNEDEGFAPICEHEPPDQRRALMDLIMTSIRLSEGVNSETVLQHAEQLGRREQILSAAGLCNGQGWLGGLDSPRWVLSDEGYLFADRVAREFIGALMLED